MKTIDLLHSLYGAKICLYSRAMECDSEYARYDPEKQRAIDMLLHAGHYINDQFNDLSKTIGK